MVVKIITVIVVLLTFVFLFHESAKELAYNDMERHSFGIRENILNSELASTKYVLSRPMLDKYNQEEQTDLAKQTGLAFVKQCGLGYKLEVEDLKTGDTWSFGQVSDAAYDGKSRG
jgi:hypothetical protein